MRGSFSVKYEHSEHPDNDCAVDWNHWERGSWIRSWKDKYGTVWYRENDNNGKMNQLAYDAMIEKFGLKSLRSELIIERIQHMSPASLVRYRKEKGLPPMKILSDTPGDHRTAEEYE